MILNGTLSLKLKRNTQLQSLLLDINFNIARMDSVQTEKTGFNLNQSRFGLLHLSKRLLIAALVVFFSLSWNLGMGQLNISSGSTLTQDFNGLGTTAITTWTNNVTLPGWYITSTSLPLQTGTSNANSCYNCGIASTNPITDRALGALSTATTHRLGLRLVNNGTTTINSFLISFTGEQWRSFNAGTLVFEYQKGSTVTSLTTGTWVPFTSLDFASLATSAGAATDGNNSSCRTAKNATLIVDVAPNTEIFFRWSKLGTSSPCLAIDDLSITASSISSYTVSFNSNSSTTTGSMSNQSIPSGGTATLTLNGFSNIGYSFYGWNTQSNGLGTNYSDGSNFTIGTSNTTLYAIWTPNNNTITFNANGGTGTMPAQTIATAATATLSTNTFSYTGFAFSGWNTLANGTGTTYANGASYTMGTTNVTLYAQWTSTSTNACPSSTSISPNTSQTICQGISANSLSITVTNSGSIGSPTNLYQWYYNTTNTNTISGATQISGATSSSYLPLSTASEIGTRYYFCVGYATNNGCSQTNTTQSLASNAVSITVNNIPTTPVFTSSTSTNNISIPCSGTTVTYSVNAIANASSYTWTIPSGWTLSSGAGTNTISVLVGSLSGNITVTATNTCGTSASATFAVTIGAVTGTSPVATAATFVGSNGFTLNWNSVANAIGYYYDLYFNATDSVVAKWTFPTSGTTLTPDVASASNTSSLLSTLGGTSAIGDVTGSATRAATATGWDAGVGLKSWQVIVNTTGFSTIKLSSKQYSSGTGPRDFKVQYKLGVAGTWTDITGGTITVATNFTSGVLSNLALPAACENQASVYLQWIMTSNTSVNLGTVASTGTSRIDSITINGTTKTYVSGYQNHFTSNTNSDEAVGLMSNTTYYYDVRAAFSCGTSANSNEISVTTLAACVPVANVTSFSPTSGPVGTLVTITGTGFTGATAVKFGTISTSNFTVINSAKIIAEVPANASTNKISVTVSGCDAFSSVNYVLIGQSGCGNTNNGSFTDLFISEIYDSDAGALSYIELFNGTAASINFSTGVYAIGIKNSASSRTNIPLIGTITSGGTVIVKLGANDPNNPPDCAVTVLQSSTTGGFNGNDIIYLSKAGVDIDYVPNPNYLVNGFAAPNFTGFSQSRTASAAGPTMTYNPADWVISTIENCTDLGVAPFVNNGATISVTNQPADVTCGALTFSVTATANPSPVGAYLWKYFNVVSGLWENASSLPGAINTNTASMSITGNTSQYLDYQFYCVITKSSCEVNTNAVQYTYSTRKYYRNKTNGNWTNPAIWEMSNSSTDWSAAVAACNYPTSTNSSGVIIEQPYSVVQDIDVAIDYLEIKSGGRLITNTLSQLTVSDSVVGPDFIVNGFWEYHSDGVNSFQFSDTITTGRWQLGAAGTIIKTNGASSSILRDKYEGGMAAIPATANWIIRYLGTDVSFTSVNTYYPNLIIESNSSLWSPLSTATSSRFTGNSFVTVKGNMDVGGTGSGTVVVFNETANAQPFLINGNLTVRNGNTFTNAGNSNGTGVEVKGNLIIDGTGTLTTNAGNGVLKITGATAQNISGAGILNVRKLFISNTAALGQNVTLLKDISVPDTVQIIQGFVDAGTTTLNGAAKLIMSGGSLQVSKNSTMLPELTGAYELTGGTVIFNGNGVGVNAQTIRPVRYYNLTSSSTGDRTMPSGLTDTVGIANVFTRGTNDFTFTGSTVNYNGAAAQNIASFTAGVTSGKTYNNLVLSNTGVKSLGGVADVEGLLSLKDNVAFSLGNQDLTLKSTLTRTAAVDQIPITTSLTYGTGRFVVERYIPTGAAAGQHGKSWQFLAIPTNGGQTINQAWQDTATSANQSRYAGYGTQLTSNLTNALALGFDVYTSPGPSMKYYTNGTWTGVSSTTNPIYNPKGYMVFVRGDRTAITYNASPTATTLRTRGKIFEPNINKPQTININAGDTMVSIGNPYASAIDFSTLDYSNCNGARRAFWVWDPLKYSSLGYGGYQYIAAGNPGGDFTPLTGGTTNYPSGVVNSMIQSGQAFFLPNSGTAGYLDFVEENKVRGSSTTFRAPVAPVNNNQYLTTLLYIGSGQSSVITDGALVTFNDRNNNDVDENDAKKIYSPGENLSILSSNRNLIVESRKTPNRNDTVFLCLNNLRRQAYQFKFAPTNLRLNDIATISLYDNYTGTSTIINKIDSTIVDFVVNADVLSYATNRFYIVFNKRMNSHNLPVVITDPRAETARTLKVMPEQNNCSTKIYIAPNPVKNKRVNLFVENLMPGTYNLFITDATSRLIIEKEIVIKIFSQKFVIDLGENASSGIYNLSLSNKISVSTLLLIVN